MLLTFWHFIGKLIGHFYDKNGNPTKAMNKFETLLEQAKKKPKYRDEDLKRFPRCITHYEVGFGRNMTCSKNRQEIVLMYFEKSCFFKVDILLNEVEHRYHAHKYLEY